MNKSTKLAKAHWGYIGKVLKIHQADEILISLIELHYTTAFIHGYKHGQEDLIEQYKKSKGIENESYFSR